MSNVSQIQVAHSETLRNFYSKPGYTLARGH